MGKTSVPESTGNESRRKAAPRESLVSGQRVGNSIWPRPRFVIITGYISIKHAIMRNVLFMFLFSHCASGLSPLAGQAAKAWRWHSFDLWRLCLSLFGSMTVRPIRLFLYTLTLCSLQRSLFLRAGHCHHVSQRSLACCAATPCTVCVLSLQ